MAPSSLLVQKLSVFNRHFIGQLGCVKTESLKLGTPFQNLPVRRRRARNQFLFGFHKRFQTAKKKDKFCDGNCLTKTKRTEQLPTETVTEYAADVIQSTRYPN